MARVLDVAAPGSSTQGARGGKVLVRDTPLKLQGVQSDDNVVSRTRMVRKRAAGFEPTVH
jgi:hypothetical protein